MVVTWKKVGFNGWEIENKESTLKFHECSTFQCYHLSVFEGGPTHISEQKNKIKKPKNSKLLLGQGDVQQSARKEPPPEQLLRQAGAQDPRGVPQELEGVRLRVLGEADHQVLRRVSRGTVKKSGPRLRDHQASWLPRGLVNAT